MHIQTIMPNRAFVLLTLIVFFWAIFLQATVTYAQTNPPLKDNVAVHDVEYAFDALRNEGEWIGAYVDNVPTGGLGKSDYLFPDHYQGIVRPPFRPDSDNNIFYVSKSGSVASNGNPADNYLGIVRIHSATRDQNNNLLVDSSAKWGERLRSNLLKKGDETSGTNPASLNDRVTIIEAYSEFEHPGGMQMVGDILAVPMEGRPEGYQENYTRSDGQVVNSYSKIYFYDTADRRSPRRLPYSLDMAEADLAIERIEANTGRDILGLTGKTHTEAGVVGFTKLPNGNYLLMITFALNSIVAVFESNQDSFFLADGVTPDPNFIFSFYDLWVAEDDYPYGTFNNGAWPWGVSNNFLNDKFIVASHQNISLINQTDGRLFLIATRNTSKALASSGGGQDKAYLFEVNGHPGDTNDFAPHGKIKLTFMKDRRFRMTTHDEPFEVALHGNGASGTGFYVSPTRELLMYSVAHAEDDLFNLWPNPERLRMSEFRHRDMVSQRKTDQGYQHIPVGAVFQPNHMGDAITVSVNQSFLVDASSHYIGPWADFYEDCGYNSNSCNPDKGPDLTTIQLMENIDWDKEDFQDFAKLDGELSSADLGTNGANDKLTGVRSGLRNIDLLFLYRNDNFDNLEDIIKFRDARSTGGLYLDSTFPNAYNDEITSARFFNLRQLLNSLNGDSTINRSNLLNILNSQGANMTLEGLNQRLDTPEFLWDTNGDGVFNIRSDFSRIRVSYDEPGEYILRVKRRGIEFDVDGQPVTKRIIVEENIVNVPNVVGLTENEAKDLLAEQDFNTESRGEFDEVAPAGIVIRQMPTAGTQVNAFSTVSFVHSIGPNPNALVPSVIGLPQAQAELLLTQASFQIRITSGPSDTAAWGNVFSQSNEGEVIARGSIITIKVSEGPSNGIAIPNLIGMNKTLAEQTLTTLDLVLGDITESYSDEIPVDQVLAQSLPAGSIYARGTVLDLNVSLGRVAQLRGDFDSDGDIDRDDLSFILQRRNQPAVGDDVEYDLNGDGIINMLDARQLSQLCTRRRCASA